MRARGLLHCEVGQLFWSLRRCSRGLEEDTLNVRDPPVAQGAAGVGTLLGMSLAKHQVHSKRRRCARWRSVCVLPGKDRCRDVPKCVLFKAQLTQEPPQVFRGNQVALPRFARPGNGKIQRLPIARTDVLEYELPAGVAGRA